MCEIEAKKFEEQKEELKRKFYEKNEDIYQKMDFPRAFIKKQFGVPLIIKTDIKPEEVIKLTRFLENNRNIKWVENLLPNIILSGYIVPNMLSNIKTRIPYIAYATPYNEQAGFIVVGDRILQFDNENYREVIHNSGVIESYEMGSCAGKFALKKYIKTTKEANITSIYKVETYSNYANIREATYTPDKRITKVLEELGEQLDFERYKYEYGLKGNYKTFYLDESLIFLGENREEKEKISVHTIYPSSKACERDILPCFVSISKNGNESYERNFILDKEWNYIDVEAYINKDKNGYIITPLELKELLAKEGLLLNPSYETAEWLKDGDIDKEGLYVIFHEYREKNIVTVSRTLKNN